MFGSQDAKDLTDSSLQVLFHLLGKVEATQSEEREVYNSLKDPGNSRYFVSKTNKIAQTAGINFVMCSTCYGLCF